MWVSQVLSLSAPGSSIQYLIDYALRILRREYEEQIVQVIVLQDIGPIYTSEGVIVLTRGTEYALPRWIALELIEKGLVKPKDEEIGLEKLAKIAYNEESTLRKPVFTKVPQYFYNMVIDEIDRLYRRLEIERKPLILSDIQRIEDYIMRIGKIRVRKLIQLLFIEPPQDIVGKLSMEERTLYMMLKDILGKWMIGLRIEKGG